MFSIFKTTLRSSVLYLTYIYSYLILEKYLLGAANCCLTHFYESPAFLRREILALGKKAYGDKLAKALHGHCGAHMRLPTFLPLGWVMVPLPVPCSPRKPRAQDSWASSWRRALARTQIQGQPPRPACFGFVIGPNGGLSCLNHVRRLLESDRVGFREL